MKTPYTVGAVVLAEWSEDNYWYPAEVLESHDEKNFYVRFFKGDREPRASRFLHPFDLALEERIMCRKKGAYKFDLWGKILEIDTEAQTFLIQIEDRDQTQTTIGFADVRVNRRATATPKSKATLKKQRELEKLVAQDSQNIHLLKELFNVYNELSQVEKAAKVGETIKKITDDKKFKDNIGKPIYVNTLHLHNVEFFGSFKWQLSEQINILLGKNGYGKTYLLRLIAAMLQENYTHTYEILDNTEGDAWIELNVNKHQQPETIRRNKTIFDSEVGRVPVLAIPAIRSLNRNKDILSNKEILFPNQTLAKDGAYHFLTQQSSDGLVENFFISLASMIKKRGDFARYRIFTVLEEVVKALTEDDGFSFYMVENLSNTAEGAKYRLLVNTEGSDTAVPIQKVSQGTLSVLVIFGLIYDFLKAVYYPHNHLRKTEMNKLFEKPAIVLIDEIDTHLHPSWQQKITFLLRQYFPAVQFILTSHSPLLVAGCQEGEVSVMRRTRHGFVIEQYQQDFMGKNIDEIYRTIFEVANIDDHTKYYLQMDKHQLKQRIEILNRKENLSEEEQEELDSLLKDMHYILKMEKNGRSKEMLEAIEVIKKIKRAALSNE